MQGIAHYTLQGKVWTLRGRFCRWQKNNTLTMFIKNKISQNM